MMSHVSRFVYRDSNEKANVTLAYYVPLSASLTLGRRVEKVVQQSNGHEEASQEHREGREAGCHCSILWRRNLTMNRALCSTGPQIKIHNIAKNSNI